MAFCAGADHAVAFPSDEDFACWPFAETAVAVADADSGSPMWAENGADPSSPKAAVAEMDTEMRLRDAKQHQSAEMEEAMQRMGLPAESSRHGR